METLSSWELFSSPRGHETVGLSAPGGQVLAPCALRWAGWGREVRQTVKLEVSTLARNIWLDVSVASLFLLWTPLMSLLPASNDVHSSS